MEESETMDLKSAVSEFQHLQETIFPEFRLGLLHGRISSVEKEAALTQFRHCQTQILVSTTVVEVGVDVSNATVMLIEHADRFGLSQLHQLRGRVGRGVAKSYCLLLNTSSAEATRQRLQVLEQSQDGFFIAERDLQRRGSGAILGTSQAGMPNFALADLVNDDGILEQAWEAAELVMRKGHALRCWESLMAEMKRRDRHFLDAGSALN